MTLTRFKQIWKTLVIDRVPVAGIDAEKACLNNGVSDSTADALVAVADGDHSEFDDIQQKLSDADSKE